MNIQGMAQGANKMMGGMMNIASGWIEIGRAHV